MNSFSVYRELHEFVPFYVLVSLNPKEFVELDAMRSTLYTH